MRNKIFALFLFLCFFVPGVILLSGCTQSDDLTPIQIIWDGIESKTYDGAPISFNMSDIEYSFNGSHKVNITYYEGDKKLNSAPEDVGNYKVVIEVEGSNRYKGNSFTDEFSIIKASNVINAVQVSTADYSYTNMEDADLSNNYVSVVYQANPLSTRVLTKFGGLENDLQQSWYKSQTDAIAGVNEISVPVDAGTYYLSVTKPETKNYTAASKIIEVYIERADSIYTIYNIYNFFPNGKVLGPSDIEDFTVPSYLELYFHEEQYYESQEDFATHKLTSPAQLTNFSKHYVKVKPAEHIKQNFVNQDTYTSRIFLFVPNNQPQKNLSSDTYLSDTSTRFDYVVDIGEVSTGIYYVSLYYPYSGFIPKIYFLEKYDDNGVNAYRNVSTSYVNVYYRNGNVRNDEAYYGNDNGSSDVLGLQHYYSYNYSNQFYGNFYLVFSVQTSTPVNLTIGIRQ